jgi:protein-disulfide isomerase
MKLSFFDAATGAIALAALAIATLAAVREFRSAPQKSGRSETKSISGPQFQALVRQGHSVGAGTAREAVVEFADFQCAYCRDAARVIAAFRERHADSIRIVFHHLPLTSVHPLARAAALAAECAAEQGRFAQFHDALFTSQSAIGRMPWDGFAKTAGIRNIGAFRRCVSERRYESVVAGDERAANEMGIEATPTFIVSGRLVEGVPTVDQLDSLLGHALIR